MIHLATQTVTYLADLTDPTSDGILTRVVNFGLSALMVLVALMGGWYAFKAWTGKGGKGDAGGMQELRHVVFGVIVVEAILGGVIVLANYGTGLIPSFTGG